MSHNRLPQPAQPSWSPYWSSGYAAADNERRAVSRRSAATASRPDQRTTPAVRWTELSWACRRRSGPPQESTTEVGPEQRLLRSETEFTTGQPDAGADRVERVILTRASSSVCQRRKPPDSTTGESGCQRPCSAMTPPGHALPRRWWRCRRPVPVDLRWAHLDIHDHTHMFVTAERNCYAAPTSPAAPCAPPPTATSTAHTLHASAGVRRHLRG
jgi:hypothetical protein